MSQQVIKADNLGKSFGSFKAISSLTFEVNKGEILGFLGRLDLVKRLRLTFSQVN